MNNAEANIVLQTKREELRQHMGNVDSVIHYMSLYEQDMDNWKTDIVTSKIAEIKSAATVAEVDLSTWDGSAV